MKLQINVNHSSGGAEGSAPSRVTSSSLRQVQDFGTRIPLRALNEIVEMLRSGARCQRCTFPRGWLLLSPEAATLLFSDRLAGYHGALQFVGGDWTERFSAFQLMEWNKKDWVSSLHTLHQQGNDRKREYLKALSKFHRKLRDQTLAVQAVISAGGSLVCAPGDYLSSAMLAVALLEVLHDVFPDFPERFSWDCQMSFYETFVSWDSMEFIKRAKFMTCAPMALLLKQELPVPPAGMQGKKVFCGSGSVNQFLWNVIHAKRNLGVRLAQGLLQGVKRGANVVSKDFVLQALQDHRAVLGLAPVATLDELSKLFFLGIKDLKESWNKAPYELETASKKACYEKTLKDGGNYAAIHEQLGLCKSSFVDTLFGTAHLQHLELPNVLQRTEMLEQSFNHGESSQFSDCAEVPLIPGGRICASIGSRPQVPVYEVVHGDDGYKATVVCRDVPVLNCTVIPICEPLKVRTITKCEAMPTFMTRPIQRHLKRMVDDLPQCVLTTRPLDMSDPGWILKMEDGAIATAFRAELASDATARIGWTSGDYKGATDRLNLNFTKLIFEAYLETSCSDHDEAFKQVYRSVLYEQELHYPKGSGLLPQLQRNGQLMGSILSFPILCYANLLCYQVALMEYLGVHIPIERLPVLVNGDDILFRATPRFYAIWKRIVDKVGFVLSIGKNYWHETFLTVNSVGIQMKCRSRPMRCFQRDQFSGDASSTSFGTTSFDTTNVSLGSSTDGSLENGVCTFWNYDYVLERVVDFLRVPYLNAGLLIGQTKLGSVISVDECPVWDIYNKVVHTSCNPNRTHRRFMSYQKKLIKELTHQGNQLFLPRYLGGLGFEPPADLVYDIGPFQRGYAAWVLTHLVEGPAQSFLPASVGVAKKVNREDILPHFNGRLKYEDVRPFPEHVTRLLGVVSNAVPFSDKLFRFESKEGNGQVDDFQGDFSKSEEPQDYFASDLRVYKAIPPESMKKFRHWKSTQKGSYLPDRFLFGHRFPRYVKLQPEVPVLAINQTKDLCLSVPKVETPEQITGKCFNLYDFVYFPKYRAPVRNDEEDEVSELESQLAREENLILEAMEA